MCLLAKIDNHEYMVFVTSVDGKEDLGGELELRDEGFELVPLDSVIDATGNIMIKDPGESKWHEMPFRDLKKLVHETMATSLIGLRSLSHQS